MRLRLRRDLHSLAGAYALDALGSPAEQDRFARHLSRCPSCGAEVRGFREVATALAFGLGGRDAAARMLDQWHGGGRMAPPPPPPRIRRQPPEGDDNQPPLV